MEEIGLRGNVRPYCPPLESANDHQSLMTVAFELHQDDKNCIALPRLKRSTGLA